jgi:hypothetical protein
MEPTYKTGEKHEAGKNHKTPAFRAQAKHRHTGRLCTRAFAVGQRAIRAGTAGSGGTCAFPTVAPFERRAFHRAAASAVRLGAVEAGFVPTSSPTALVFSKWPFVLLAFESFQHAGLRGINVNDEDVPNRH